MPRPRLNPAVRVYIITACLSLHSPAPVSAAAVPGPTPNDISPGLPSPVPLPPREILRPRVDCASLTQHDLSQLPDAPTRLISAEMAAGDTPDKAYCRIRGYVSPQIQFELRLPTQGYTGRYLQGGCGGVCGSIDFNFSPSADNALAFGGAFAVGFNDSGHKSASGRDTVWAATDPVLREDFAFRATHVAAVAAKAIINLYYGQPPALSYFDGCSNGGRQGLMEAQRFPEDFSGIIAGAPAFWITPGVVRILWETRVATDAEGQQILTPQSLQLLHAAVMNACDKLDGLKDGQIDDPRGCHFDPGRLRCRSAATMKDCLTTQQVEVARRLYQGPVDDDGRPMYLGGEPYGSELNWSAPGSFTHIGATLAATQIRDMIFDGQVPTDFDWRSWALNETHLRSLFEHGGYYDTSSGNLHRFREIGGKLILWVGAADNSAGPNVLPDYYQRVRDQAGGLAATRTFARAFTLPGVYHCGGGYVPYQTHLLSALVAWIERGSAPDKILTQARLPDGAYRTRPVYAYPVRARYKGVGNPDDAASFSGVEPKTEPDDHYHWLGEHMTDETLPQGLSPTKSSSGTRP